MTVAMPGAADEYVMSPYQEWLVRSFSSERPAVSAAILVRGVGQEDLGRALRTVLETFALMRVEVAESNLDGHVFHIPSSPRPEARWSQYGGLVRANSGGGAMIRVNRLDDESWRVTVEIPAALADAQTVRMLQRDIANALVGIDPHSRSVAGMLKYAQWQRALSDRKPTDHLGREKGRVSAAVLRSRSSHDSELFWAQIDMGKAAAVAVRRVSQLLGLEPAVVVLSAWGLAAGQVLGGAELEMCVAKDGRRHPVPDDTLGQLTEWGRWVTVQDDGQLVRERLRTTAEFWASLHAQPQVFGHQVVRQNLPEIGFELVPDTECRTSAGKVVELRPPVPVALTELLTLVPSVGDGGGRLGLWFDGGRLCHEEAAGLLETVRRVLELMPDLLSQPVRTVRRAGTSPGAEVEATTETVESVWCRVQRQAERTPGAPAIGDGQRVLNYAELASAVKRLADQLRAAGVLPEDRVGLLLGDTPAVAVAMLAILACGAAYVPLHTSLPPQRIHRMLDAARPRAVVASAVTGGALPADLPVVEVDHFTGEPTGEICPTSCDAIDTVAGQSLAYILFTSGSTGDPKGVMVTRGGLDNYVDWALRTYQVSEGAGVVVHTLPTFDLTVTGLLVPLAAGQFVRLVPPSAPIDALIAALQEVKDVSLVKATPAHLSLLNRMSPESAGFRVRTLVLGGEELPTDTVEDWLRTHPHCRVFNEYGPTETVVGCTYWRVDGTERGWSGVPIGSAVAGASVVVCDGEGHPVHPGVTGELVVGGVGVARGYLNDPRTTALRFRPDPTGEPGSRAYHTGDLAVATVVHGLRYLGRVDEQINLRGFRIEPAEIERALRTLDGVLDAAVSTVRSPAGELVLAAAVVGDPVSGVSDEQIRTHLAAVLPAYMVPSFFSRVAELPLSRNGKLDRSALPVPAFGTARTGKREPAVLSPTEELVHSIWADVLNLAAPDPDTRFFELGGTSFSLVSVNARLAESLNREIPVAVMFEHLTIRSLAAYLDAHGPGAAGSDPAQRAQRRRSGAARLADRRSAKS
ncbi:amino acid adenylation domain-containing protein [Kitasatospora griseola]|uniref:amino acid adenylation domain-containing protein n=1 Tax=Kitasatospora griseola TaxID=2064 RepID=UPI003446F1B3